MVDPQIWRNEKIGSLSDAGRLLFIGIFSQADDDGKLKASPRFLMANIFPYDKDKIEEDIRHLRDQCAELGLIRVYTNGKEEYLDIPGWHEHQQIRKDRYNPSSLPPFEEADNQPTTTVHQPTTTVQPNIIESSLIKGIPTVSAAAGIPQEKTKKQLKPHQQEAGKFLDLVEKEEKTKLLNRPKLINMVRKLFTIEGTFPEKLLDFYSWLKSEDSFFHNKAPPQIIAGMPDRYPSWLVGKLKPMGGRRPVKRPGQLPTEEELDHQAREKGVA